MELTTREKVLKTYLENPTITVTALAKLVGIAQPTASHCLKKLEQEGLLVRHFTNRSENGRRGKGADAFTPKNTGKWDATQKRIEAIVARNQKSPPRCEYKEAIADGLHVRFLTWKNEELLVEVV